MELPKDLYGLHARYANALYVAATKNGSLGAVETDVNEFKELVKGSPEFRTYLRNPIISRSDKEADLNRISKGMNETTRGFLGVLASNGRLGDVEKVIDRFQELMRAQRGLVAATVISAEPLNKKQLAKVKQAIAKGYLDESKGENLELEAKVDPSILGGLQIQIGDRFLDLSIQARVNKLHQTLSNAK